MRYVPAILALGAAACVVGNHPLKYSLANDPAGAEITVTTMDRVVHRGELLVVDDTAAVMLAQSGELRWVPLRTIMLISTHPGSISFHAPKGIAHLDPESRRRLRLVSRYPYGVSPEILADIAAHPVPAEPRP